MSAGSKEGGEEAGASLLAGSQHFIGVFSLVSPSAVLLKRGTLKVLLKSSKGEGAIRTSLQTT